MATFDIDVFDNISFNLPGKSGKKIELQVPPLDCFTPDDIDAINGKLKELETITPTESVRVMLAHYAKTEAQKSAVTGLVARQITQIDEIWTKESGITVGESEPSTDTSSEPATTE
ncbi:hypothetical protein [Corynebacterium diphtheriae]|uniref:hypothetical protein n=1 Tax=Corynebacterium diphtheriae TaxID=1717 RepID=UPI0013CCA4A1|nr:hypothetical protein [Corynebacterium diphtheriae]CAB0628053.1 hypothetical protein CIP107563_00182 [Corynebacterium diphtheriae]CAB0639201.1 hypothetical protein CIP107572_00753 [Corynebacterium diphtheriae]